MAGPRGLFRPRGPAGRVLALAGHLLDAVVGLVLLAIVAITVAGVVARYGLGASLPWTGELSVLLYVWMIALAAARAGHMRITMIVDALPPTLRRIAEGLALAVSLACLWLLVDGSITLWRLTAGDRFTALPLSQSLFFVAIVVGGSLWAVVLLARFVAPPRKAAAEPPPE